jgi:hypothetical protein
MPFTEKHVLDELKKQGVTTMDELAKKIAEQSAAKHQWDHVRGLSGSTEVSAEYLWSGKNYSLYHPE